MKAIEIYTDGACSGNPGPGGYGVVMICDGRRKEIAEGFKLTTNNRMEVLAVIKGLEALNRPCEVTLYSDSKYVVDAVEKGWVKKWKANNWKRNKTQVASNIDLWEKILNLLTIHKVKFVWVKGHNDNPENERCDQLGRNSIISGNLKEDKGYKK